LEALLERINVARHGAFPVDGAAELEASIESRFRASCRLAVYGSLAPGKDNHHLLAGLGGDWSDGRVEGELYASGWGARHGFPGLRWIPGHPGVTVRVLTADGLPDHWPILDEFEGTEYRRILVPVLDNRGAPDVANLYECVPGDAASGTGAPSAPRG
jgi:gamma-glutamylcyclotransferase (GGCT)/AIG2-like uncharacterized protein YtfP